MVHQWIYAKWLRYGTSKNCPMIPLHIWNPELYVKWCRVLIKVQFLTRNDSFSTVGAKLAAIKFNPVQYFSGFGETQDITKTDVLLADKYLVSV